MPIVTIAPLTWINTDAVGAISSDTEILKPSDEDKKRTPDDKRMRRVTVFKSLHGAELVRLVGEASWSTDSQDSNPELKAMHYIHDEAIAAAKERREAVPYNQSAQRR